MRATEGVSEFPPQPATTRARVANPSRASPIPLLERGAGELASIHTAGSGAASGIDPNVQTAMAEIGIDLSDKFTRPLTAEVLASADLVITMGRSVGQIEIPAKARHLDWRVGDPAGAEIDEVRRVRDDIERRVNDLAVELRSLVAVGSAPVGGT